MASEYTPNYNLDLYASEDKPNLRDQYNAAMGKIDTQLKANADGVTNVSASVVAATTAANEAKQIAQDAAPINHASSNPTYGLGTSINYGHVAVRGSIGTPTIQEDGLAASPKAVYDYAAPKNHASSNATYGIGNTTSYGHVKLVDSATATGSSTAGVAATPSCVDNKLAPVVIVQDAQVSLSELQSGKTVSVHISGNRLTGHVSINCTFLSFLSFTSTRYHDITVLTVPSTYSWAAPKHNISANVGDQLILRAINNNGILEVHIIVNNNASVAIPGLSGATLSYYVNE